MLSHIFGNAFTHFFFKYSIQGFELNKIEFGILEGLEFYIKKLLMIDFLSIQNKDSNKKFPLIKYGAPKISY